jgi:hypothetical protein
MAKFSITASFDQTMTRATNLITRVAAALAVCLACSSEASAQFGRIKSHIPRSNNSGILRGLDPSVATSSSLLRILALTMPDRIPLAPKSPSGSTGTDYFGGPGNALAAPPSLGPIPPENASIADLLANPRVGGEGQLADDSGHGVSAWALVSGVGTPGGGGLPSCMELSPAWGDSKYWSDQGGSASSQRASGDIFDPSVLTAADQAAPLGTAGGWCRPPNEPFVDSSPLANGSVWTLTLIVVIGTSILLISRGWRLPV